MIDQSPTYSVHFCRSCYTAACVEARQDAAVRGQEVSITTQVQGPPLSPVGGQPSAKYEDRQASTPAANGTFLAAYSFKIAVHHGVTYSGMLGYRALGVDFEKGSGASRYEYDVVQDGPLLGLKLSF